VPVAVHAVQLKGPLGLGLDKVSHDAKLAKMTPPVRGRPIVVAS